MSAFPPNVPTVAIITACLWLWLSPPILAEPPPRPNVMLHQRGTRIVDQQGAEVHLRGVNLGGWLLWEGRIFGDGPLTPESTILSRLEKVIGVPETAAFRTQVYDNFITEADIQRIADAGFNCVRVPLHHRLFADGSCWKRIDLLLDWCERRKIYVVLDLHAVPGGQSKLGMADPGDARQLVWASAENQQRTVELWSAIAARCNRRTFVAGYDLINEPAPPTGEALVALYNRIIPAIRAIDPDHLIFLEGRQFSTDFSMFEKPLCENQAFSCHMYTWFGDDRQKQLSAYRTLAQRQNTPMWVGEFGENSYAMIQSTVEMYAACPEINGWTFWTWKKAPTRFPGLAVIRVPSRWKICMAWIASLFGGNAPNSTFVLAAIPEFIKAMQIKNCEYDDRMGKALRAGH